MTWYCYWSAKKQATWQLALATERPSIIASGKAEFTTALDLDQDLDSEGIEQDKVRYNGPFYLDFDSGDISETISQANVFLAHLEECYALDLNQIALYASGKKGFHIEIPQKLFVSKPSHTGYLHLPAIYKEMSFAMYHDTLDMSVYTAKKGRMWRCPNFKRPDTGTYKVQVTLAEMQEMTDEYYGKVISVPRPCFPINPETVCNKLELLWAQCRDKIERATKRGASKKRDAGILAKADGKAPPTLAKLMNGEGIKDGAGFQQIATQLAIAAHGLNLSCEDFLKGCQGLCENHVGDGDRYRSVGQRRKELARMWHYMEGNPTYDFSGAAIRALVDGPAPDLMVGSETDIGEDGKSDLAITLGMTMDKTGIYKLTEDGFKQRVSVVGISNLRYLQDLKTGDAIGYDADLYVEGRFRQTKRITMDYLLSKNRFQALTGSVSGSCQITDTQVNALIDVFRRTAERNGGDTVYVVNREGLDVVRLPDDRYDNVWVDDRFVLSKLGIQYGYLNGLYGGESLPFGTDLMSAPRILGSRDKPQEYVVYLNADEIDRLKKDLNNLLRMNTPMNVAKILGWIIACFLCPSLRKEFHRFPLLQLFGPSGAGKSTTIRAFARFHYHRNVPMIVSASNSTLAPLSTKVTGTSSLPLIVDEYKPSEMMHSTVNALRGILRDSMDGIRMQRGRVSRESGDSQVVTQAQEQVAPIVFISEQMETQKAIVERSLIVPLTEHDNTTHSKYAYALGESPKYFGSVGRYIVERLIFDEKVSPERIADRVGEFQEQIGAFMRETHKDRPIYAMAVAAAGLDFFRWILQRLFDDEFNEILSTLLKQLTDPPEERRKYMAPVIKAEIVQVFNTLAHLSQFDTPSEERRLMPGKDYGVGLDYVELQSRNCFMKYRLYCRATGETALYNSSDAFKAALEAYSGSTKVVDSPLGNANVYRLDMRRLYEIDGVDEFKS